MNYKFNNGYGAILCSKCRIIVDEGLSYKEAVELYGETEVFCHKCAIEMDTVEK